jgi:hypothetical protein
MVRAQRDRIKPKGFDPAKSDWRDYFAQFLHVSEYNGWTQQEQKLQLISVLEGEATGVFSDNPTADLNELIRLLEDRFPPKDREKSYHFQFRSRTLKKDEKPEDYAGALSRLARRAYPQVDKISLDKMLVHQFTEGLSQDPELHKYVALDRSTTLASAITACSQYLSYRTTTKTEDKATTKKTKNPKTEEGTVAMASQAPQQRRFPNQGGRFRRGPNFSRGGRTNPSNSYQRNNNTKPYQPPTSNQARQPNQNFQGQSYQTGQPKTYTQNAGGQRPQNRSQTMAPTSKAPFQCHYCTILGHSWRVCFKRQRENPGWIPDPNLPVYGPPSAPSPPPWNPQAGAVCSSPPQPQVANQTSQLQMTDQIETGQQLPHDYPGGYPDQTQENQ